MAKRYYVAYGSNLNLCQMQGRCPGAMPIGTARLENYELLFKGSKTGAYLTIEPKTGGEVPVGIWAVTKADELALDRYEGYPDFYYKKELQFPVRFLNGKTQKLNCFVYIMHEKRKIGVPSLRYLYTCMEGYEDFGFDPKPLLAAYTSAKEVAGCEGQFHFRRL